MLKSPLLRVLIKNGFEFIKCFLAFIVMIIWHFFFSVLWWITVIDFFKVKLTLHSWNKLHWCNVLFLYIVGLNVLKFCWNYLHLCLEGILAYSFLILSWSGFGIGIMMATQNGLENVPSSSIFWNSLYRIGNIFPLNVCTCSFLCGKKVKLKI